MQGKMLGSEQLVAENLRLRTELMTANERAKRDEVTQLYRRWYFMQCVEADIDAFGVIERRHHAPPQPQSAVFMILDLKNFSQFNDLPEGQLAGDVMLQHTGEAMLRVLRKGEKLGRLGGDEFGLWFNMKSSMLETKIKQINDSLASEDPRLAVHTGHSFYRPGMQVEDLYREASISLREAKKRAKQES